MKNNIISAMRPGDLPGDVHIDTGQQKINSKNSENLNQSIRAINIKELLEYKFPERDYILDPIIPSQGLTMIYAGRGIGKTHIALNIAFVAACGGELFGKWKAPEQKRVLYIDGEMPGISLQERLAQIIASAPEITFDPDNLRILTNDLQEFGLPDLGTLEGQMQIREFTDNADLIILDNISTLCRTGAENKSDDWGIVQQWALRMRAQQRSVLYIHHAGKGGAQRGTSKREDILDTVISLRRPSDYEPNQGARFEVHFEKARGITGDEVNPFVAELSTDGGRYAWSVNSLEESTFEKVIKLSKDGLTQSEIASEIGINKSNICRHLKRAKDEGLLNG